MGGGGRRGRLIIGGKHQKKSKRSLATGEITKCWKGIERRRLKKVNQSCASGVKVLGDIQKKENRGKGGGKSSAVQKGRSKRRLKLKGVNKDREGYKFQGEDQKEDDYERGEGPDHIWGART